MTDLSEKSPTHEQQRCAGYHVTDYQSGIHRRYQRRIEMGMLGVCGECRLRNLIWTLESDRIWINLEVG